MAANLKALLTEWSKYIMENGGNDDPAEDNDGNTIRRQNETRSIWLIPGSWGKTDTSRTLRDVPRGKQFFLVAASSHSTKDEIPSGQQPTPANLTDYAKKVDQGWNVAGIQTGQMNGPFKHLKLTTVTTGVFKVNIPSDNGYAIRPGIRGNNIDMVTVGRVALFTPPTGTSRIVIGGTAPAVHIGRKPEERYDVNVSYEVIVP